MPPPEPALCHNPLAAPGLVAGCVVAWARAVGVFGPLLVFVGVSP